MKKRAKPIDYEKFCMEWYEARGFMCGKTTNWTAYGKHDLWGFCDVLVLDREGRASAIQVTDRAHLKEHMNKYATKAPTKKRIQALVARKVRCDMFICFKNKEGKPELLERYRYVRGGDYPISVDREDIR